jgi:hypothetical protein
MDDAFEDIYVDRFSLRSFCTDVAALAKYLIRARETSEPNFLGGPESYAKWHLPDHGEDTVDVRELLKLATLARDKVWHHMLDMGGSGGVPMGDPLHDFKTAASRIIIEETALKAVVECPEDVPTTWTSFVDWSLLSPIRNHLDHLQILMATTFPKAEEPQLQQVSPSGRVWLFRSNNHMAAIVDGVIVKSLLESRRAVILPLLKAGTCGLAKNDLINQSGAGGAVDILKLMAKAEIWQPVIYFPGAARNCYKIF